MFRELNTDRLLNVIAEQFLNGGAEMKKYYETPVADIEKFSTPNDVITTSNGIGDYEDEF